MANHTLAADVITALSNGYELRTVDDFRSMLSEAGEVLIQRDGLQGAASISWATERLEQMLRFVTPNAKFVLWKRSELYIVLSPTLESLRAEFPWLRC